VSTDSGQQVYIHTNEIFKLTVLATQSHDANPGITIPVAISNVLLAYATPAQATYHQDRASGGN
jgi:hypothetical protein